MSMVIGAAKISLHLHASHSLKDKRQVVKSLVAQVQNRFNVAAAEVERQDQWQVAVVGIVCVSTDGRHADEVLARVVDFIENRWSELEMLGYETELLHAL